MKKLLFTGTVLLLSLLFQPGVRGQTTYTMRDTLVRECQGWLTDSDEGLDPGTYDHDENLTFTICPDTGITSITLTFYAFCTEASFDFLRIFAGTDTLSPLIGTYFGITIPPPITTSGCITINFTSDLSINCSGWLAHWDAILTDPVQPVMTVSPVFPTCSTSILTLTFDQPIPCDSVIPANFNLVGNLAQTLTPVPIGCNPDSTTTVQMTLNPGLDRGGQYVIQFLYDYRDVCDSLWHFVIADTFGVNDCPMILQISLIPQSICPGECATLEAHVTGGDSTTYQFTWNNGLPNSPGPFQVCPNNTTTYTLTVSDAGPAPNVSGQVTLTVLTPPTLGPNRTVCQSNPPFNIVHNPPGGLFQGTGITDSLNGIYDPSVAGQGTWPVVYIGPNGCRDTMTVTVLPVDAGWDVPVCPGSAPFTLVGSPPGGTWSGPNVTPGGLYTPPVFGGTFTLTYTFGTCSDTRNIIVANIVMPPDTSLCASDPGWYLSATPPGGWWAGPGIRNAGNGEFNPRYANTGPNTITYNIQGCSASMTINITAINAGPDMWACPKQAPYILINNPIPPGGTWSGTGILNVNTGLFDPGANNGLEWSPAVTYTAGGCVDVVNIYVRQTAIWVDTMAFCQNDPPIILDNNTVGRNVSNGNWSGPGITDPNWPGTFDPGIPTPGYHTLSYLANTCMDSFIVLIRPASILSDTSVCEVSGPFFMYANPSGGDWYGPNIDPSGYYYPQSAGVGTHNVFYNNPFGCADDTAQIIVYALQPVTLSGLNQNYCNIDSNILLIASPPGGTYSGPGVRDSLFNPFLAGPGTHIITYTEGSGNCQQTAIISTTVGLPLLHNVNVSDDTLCGGESAILTASVTGGTGSGYSFYWDSLGTSFQQIVSPTVSTNYVITISDGCSSPVIDTIRIFVEPAFSVNFDTSAIQCFGEDGYAVANVQGSGTYTYRWGTVPRQTGDTLLAPASSSYSVTITEVGSGCVLVSQVRIPGYDEVQAIFLPNPVTCAFLPDPKFSFIDLSKGLTTGTWDYGDGVSEPYITGLNPDHTYPDIGTYTVTLFGENTGGCKDTFALSVCVEARPLEIPNTFTPNGDGNNDNFEVIGIERYPDNMLKVYNRYGNLVWETERYQNNWQGTNMKGDALPDGAYYYIFYPNEEGKKEVVGNIVIFR